MFERPGRLIALVVATVLAVAVVVVVARVELPPRQTRGVAVPPSDATPEQVVAAYLDALDAHDCDTAEALMTDEAKGSAESWCADVAGLQHVEVSHHFLERPRYSGHSAPQEVANVPVTFDLSWRPFHDDGSMEQGPTIWGYLLVRDSPDSPWRIFDQGTG